MIISPRRAGRQGPSDVRWRCGDQLGNPILRPVRGRVCEIHPDAPLVHHVDQAEACGVAMACTNPTCLLSWANETDPETGLIRVAALPGPAPPGPWRLASPVLRRDD
jgi:hypothetical protein